MTLGPVFNYTPLKIDTTDLQQHQRRLQLANLIFARSCGGGGWGAVAKKRKVCGTPSGNRTRVSPVAGEYSTTRPTVCSAMKHAHFEWTVVLQLARQVYESQLIWSTWDRYRGLEVRVCV